MRGAFLMQKPVSADVSAKRANWGKAEAGVVLALSFVDIVVVRGDDCWGCWHRLELCDDFCQQGLIDWRLVVVDVRFVPVRCWLGNA